MRALPGQIWNQRKHPRRVVRLLWWGALACAAAAVAATPALRGLATLAWAAGGILTLLAAAGWGIFHPRAVLAGAGAALRWALWLTPLTVLALIAGLSALAAQAPALGAAFFPVISGAELGLALVFSPLVLLFLLALGMAAAAVGAWEGRRRPGRSAAAAGVAAWWLTTLGLLPLVFGARDERQGLLWLGLPLGCFWVSRVASRVAGDPQSVLHRGLRWVSRRLVLRWRRGDRTRTADLRGLALGLAGGAVALALSVGDLLTPIQASALSFYLQVRGMPTFGGVPPGVRDAQEQIVLLQMDEATRHRALTRASEAAVQAELIRHITPWQPPAVVVSAPVLAVPSVMPQPPPPPGSGSGIRVGRRPGSRGAEPPAPFTEVPGFSEAAARRSVTDLPALDGALRAAGNVYLTLTSGLTPADLELGPDGELVPRPSADALGKGMGQLRAAARDVAQGEVQAFGSLRIPALSVRWPGSEPPLALLLAAQVQGQPAAPRAVAGGDAVELAGARFPLFPGRRVLVTFHGVPSGEPFHRVPYGAVLRQEPVFVEDPGGGAGRWVPMREYLRDRLVFLDSLASRRRPTPAGLLSNQEVLAHAAVTLLAPDPITPLPRAAGVAAALLLGCLAGALSMRREPLDAGWRTAVVAFGVIAVSLLAFMAGGTWIDPVLPLCALVAGNLLAAQFNFTAEREDRERSRGLLERFVAPQVVEQLLDNVDGLGLGGKRQQVCVLFADVRNFSGFAERHSPEMVVEVINDYLTAMTQALFEHEGILDKYTGDGLMAFFPISGRTEEVRRAVTAALAMRDAAMAVSSRLEERGEQALAIGIGMHYGEAVVGLVGNPRQFNYTALGQAVIVSQRLQGIAGGGEVVVSETVYEASGGDIPAQAGAPVRVKGISQPVTPYRVLGPGEEEPGAPEGGAA